MHIRASTIDDVVEFDRIRQAAEPWHAASVELQRLWFAMAKPDAIRLTAEVDGRVVGFGSGGLEHYSVTPGAASFVVTVDPPFRRRGIGTELATRVEAHLAGEGARVVQALLIDEPDSVSFAGRRGYKLGATMRYVVVDPRELPPVPATPDAVTVLPAAEVGPEAFHAVVDVAARDEPGDLPFAGIPLDEFLEREWPGIDQRVSMIALVDGEPAATTLLAMNVGSGRAMSAGSDCLREYRGRGLVKLIKSVSLRAAADLGITAAYTSNDETNAPIRAINAWLGYRPVGATRSALKQVDE